MSLQTPKDLFVYELQGMYDAEQKIVQMLQVMMQEVQNPQIKSAFEQHEHETKQQILNLDQCFQAMGLKPETKMCHGVVGLKQEHEAFRKEKPADEILMMHNLDLAAETEQYEITCYKGLIGKANFISQGECVRLLQQNLAQEEAMLKRVEMLSQQLGQQVMTRMK